LSEYWLSITIVLTTFLSLGVSAYIFSKVFDHVFACIESVSRRLLELVLGDRRPRYLIFLLEVLYIILILGFLLLSPQGLLYFLLFTLVTIIWGSCVHFLRKTSTEYFSIFDWARKNINPKGYIASRVYLIFEQIQGILTIMAALVLTYSFLYLHWPLPVYYLAFLALPVYMNSWIYFTWKLKFNDNDVIINIRRIISYSLLATLLLHVYFLKFINASLDTDVESKYFILLGGGVIFTAIDRVAKTILDDYRNHLKNE
jgi:hypothetical protein